MKNALIPGTPFWLWIYGNMPTILVINTEEKLHRFFFNVINWPKVGENYEAAFRKKY
jgi:Fe-Mn family superoxide dismutase